MLLLLESIELKTLTEDKGALAAPIAATLGKLKNALFLDIEKAPNKLSLFKNK